MSSTWRPKLHQYEVLFVSINLMMSATLRAYGPYASSVHLQDRQSTAGRSSKQQAVPKPELAHGICRNKKHQLFTKETSRAAGQKLFAHHDGVTGTSKHPLMLKTLCLSL